MKKILFFLGVISYTLVSLAQDKVINDANAVSRSVRDFHAVAIEDGIDLYITQSNEEAVAVSASKAEYRNKIVTVVEDGVLRIYYNQKNDWDFWWNPSRKLRAYVSFKTIDQIRGSGGSDVIVNGTIKVPKLKLGLSGGSDFKGAVEVDNLDISASGGSDINISGRATKLDFDGSGGSDFKGYGLKTEVCFVAGSGGCDMELWVDKELTVHTSGGGDVHYKGNAVIRESKTSGGGSVSKRD